MRVVKNPNTSRFWDLRIRQVENISKEDYVTQNRINYIASSIQAGPRKLLDVGVGYGFLEKEIRKRGLETIVFGIDLSDVGIKRATRIFGNKFLISSATNLPFKSSMFDYVCILEVLEHLYKKQAVFALKEAIRVLSSGGKLIISVPLYDPPSSHHPSGHVRRYTPNILFSELNSLGLIQVSTEYFVAFKSQYKIKNFVNKFLCIRKPNIIIVIAEKA